MEKFENLIWTAGIVVVCLSIVVIVIDILMPQDNKTDEEISKKSAAICDCGDKNCKREVKGTKEGKLYVVNHFTCGKVKKVIKNTKIEI